MAILDLSTYKTYKAINSGEYDAQLTLIIDAVNTFIEAYTGRVFTTYYNSDKIELFDANASELYPIEHPIVSITSLKYSSDAGASYATSLVEYTDYIIDHRDESVIALKDQFAAVTYPIGALELTYKAGYSTVPNDLQLAAVHITDYYKDEDYIPRKSLSGASIDNVIQPDMTARLPAHIRRVLESYRNIAF